MAERVAQFFRVVDANPGVPVDPLVYEFFGCSQPWDQIDIGGRLISASSIKFWAVGRRYHSEGHSAEDQAAAIVAKFLDSGRSEN